MSTWSKTEVSRRLQLSSFAPREHHLQQQQQFQADVSLSSSCVLEYVAAAMHFMVLV